MKVENRPYIKAIDTLRATSILAVLLIHTSTKVLEATQYDLINYSFTLFLNQMVRFAVPLFFLISGFVLELSNRPGEKYITYLKRRFSKIVIPYVFWSLIYYFFIYNQNHDNLVWVLLTGGASYQLYFIPTLCIFYLLFPFIHKLIKSLHPLGLGITTILLGFLQIQLMNQDYFVKQFSYIDPIRIFLLAYFIFTIGIAAAQYKDRIIEIIGKIKYIFIVVIPYFAYYIFNEGQTRYFNTYNIEAFYSQWRVSVLFYTLAVFSALFYAFDKSHLQFTFIEKLSKLSFLVFFIHVIILENVWKYFGQNNYGFLGFDFIYFTVVTIISFGLAYFLHKIPRISKLIG